MATYFLVYEAQRCSVWKRKRTCDSSNQLINVRGPQYKYLIVVSIDGASTMTGHENRFVSFVKKKILNLIAVHYVAHCESLAVVGSSMKIPKFLYF